MMNLHGRSGLTNLCVLTDAKLVVIPWARRIARPRRRRILHFYGAAQDGSKKMILITGSSGRVGKKVLQEAIRKESKAVACTVQG